MLNHDTLNKITKNYEKDKLNKIRHRVLNKVQLVH